MRFRQLRYFCKIVECGSFSRAAATIHIAQPALSQQISELEAQLNVELLQRSARGVKATRAGEILYKEALNILKQLDALPALVRSNTGVVEGSVSLGIVRALGPRIAGDIVAACREKLPKVTLKLSAADSTSLRERVEAQSLDMAVVFEPEFQQPPLARKPLFRQRVYFLPHQKMPDPTAPLSLAQLAQMPLVMPSQPNVARVLLEQALNAAGMSPTIVVEVDDLATVLASVRSGLGSTIITTGNLASVGANDLPPPMLIEPALHVIASIISDSTTPLSRAGEALRSLLVPLIRNHLQSEQVPGAEWLGDPGI
jgi:LysR family transcriptional regulator, nitrogen assimilation regulatory protein